MSILEKALGQESLNRKIRVGFAVTYASAFPAKPLYNLMLSSHIFEPVIVLIPDALREKENFIGSLIEQERALGEIANELQWGVDRDSAVVLDAFRDMDLICFSTPYAEMTLDLHSIASLTARGKLVFYINYSFGVSVYDLNFLHLGHITRLWKVFLPTRYHAKRWQKYNPVLKDRIIVSGYPKLDLLLSGKTVITHESQRKRVILAPHHSVDTHSSDWSLGDFLLLADRYAEIPTMFPSLDFIFRPHPLLRNKLENNPSWGKDRTADYFSFLESQPNVEIDLTGNYTELFLSSDAMIHNSGSFLAEYLFTGKPAGFMIQDVRLLKKSLNPYGLKCLKSHHALNSTKDVKNFIEKTVIGGKDSLKWRRAPLVDEYVAAATPSASEKILEHITLALLRTPKTIQR